MTSPLAEKLRRATLMSQLLKLRAERLKVTGTSLQDRLQRTKLIAQILKVRAELFGTQAAPAVVEPPAAEPAPAVADPVEQPTPAAEQAPAEDDRNTLPDANDPSDDAYVDDPVGSSRNPAAHLYAFDPNRKPAQRRRENKAAMDLLQRINAGEIDGKSLTDEQKGVLARYSGTGGGMVGADGKKGSDYEYYTPKPIAEGVWELAKSMGFGGGKVLDPCGGTGIFGGTAPASAVIDAVELNETSAQVNELVNGGPGYRCTNAPFEKVAASTPDETHDLIITNVPFGTNAARGGNQFADPKYQSETLENYFILRSLEKLRPGGLALFIVPTRCISGKGGADERTRIRASYMAEFIGAYRLPSTLFLTAGTEVITDVMVFRKHGRDALDKIAEIREQDPAKLRDAKVLWDEFVEGRYFTGEGAKNVLGTPAKAKGKFGDVDVLHSDLKPAEIARLMRKLGGSRIDWDALDATETAPIVYNEGDTVTQSGQTLRYEGGQWVPIKTVDDSEAAGRMGASLVAPLAAFDAGVTWQQARDYHAYCVRMSTTDDLYDWFRATVAAMLRLPTEADRERYWQVAIVAQSVQQAYDHHQSTERGFRYNVEYPELTEAMQRVASDAASLPSGMGEPVRGSVALMRVHYTRKAGFSGLWQGSTSREAVDSRDTSQKFEAAKYKAGGAWVDIEEARSIFGAEFDPMTDPAWCISPDGRSVSHADDFFVGNYGDMLDKLKAQAANATDEKVREKLLAMAGAAGARVQRVDVSSMQFNLFSPFVTLEEKCQFLRTYFAPGFMIEYNDEGGARIGYKAEKVNENAHDKVEYQKLMGRLAVYTREATVTLANISVRSKQKSLQQLRELTATANEQFNAWAKSNASIVDRLEAKANDPHSLQFQTTPDQSPLPLPGWKLGEPPNGVTPHPYQYAFIRAQGRRFGGINGYAVGLGKSFTALASVQHAHNIGIKKKTAFVVPNSVLSNWRKEASVALEDMSQCLFVGLNIDAKGKAKVNPGDYDRDLNVIAEGRHSKIFMTFEAFKRLRLREATINRYVSDLSEADSAFAESESKKDDERAKGKGATLANRLMDNFSPAAPFLEDIGIDSVVIDEAHAMKNSAQSSNFKSARYLSLADTSAIGDDAQIKCWFIRGLTPARDGVMGLTATPITNSPLEIYSMLSLVAGRERVNEMTMGVRGADDFLRTVCNVESEEDETLDGIVRDTRVFKGLTNVDVLRRCLSEVCTIETPETVGMTIKLPTQDDNATKVPLNDDVREILEVYKGAYRWVKDKEADYPDSLNRGSEAAYELVKSKFGEPDELIAHPFNLLRKMSAVILDPDLDQQATIYSFAPADEEKAAGLVAKFNALKLIEDRDRPSQHTADDAVVGSKEVKDGDDKKTVLRVAVRAKIVGNRIILDSIEPDAQEKFEKLEAKAGLSLDVSVPPKLAAMLANFQQEEANPRGIDSEGNRTARVKQLIFCDQLATHAKIRRILSKHAGVQVGQIAIVTGRTNSKPEQIIEVQNEFNADGGAYRVVLANEKAEVGINLQRGTQAIHHLTIGWTPDSLTQRNGRGVRQGNKTDRVNVYHYDADGTFDVHKRGMVNRKANWIDAVMSQDGGASVDIEGGMSREQEEALIDSVGDADAMTRFREQLEAKEREARASGVRAKQAVNLRTIDANKRFLKDYAQPTMWAAKAIVRYYDLSRQVDVLRSRAKRANTPAPALLKLQASLASFEAQAEGVRAQLAEALGLGGDAEQMIERIIDDSLDYKNKGKRPEEERVERRIRAGLKLQVAEGSALHSDWQSEVDIAQGMIDASRQSFMKYAEQDGGMPESVAASFEAGEATMLDGKPVAAGCLLEFADGRVAIVTNEGRRAAWWVADSDGRYVLNTDYMSNLDKWTIHYPGSTSFSAVARRAAEIEDKAITSRKGDAVEVDMARLSAEVGKYRTVESMRKFEEGREFLPLPCFYRPITEDDTKDSPFLQSLYEAQKQFVTEVKSPYYSSFTTKMSNEFASSRTMDIKDFVRMRGVVLEPIEASRLAGSSIFDDKTLRSIFNENIGTIADAIESATSEDDVNAKAIEFVTKSMPLVKVTPDKYSRFLLPSELAAVAAKIKSLAQPPQPPVAQAVMAAASAIDPETIGDDQLVGIFGNTKPWKELIKSTTTSMGEKYSWCGYEVNKQPSGQWNVPMKVWRRLIKENPRATQPGQLQLVEYRKR